MKRVKVDFSTTVRGGMIRASQRRASDGLEKGDRVEAYDPAEGMEFVGTVEDLSPDGRFAYLRMDWEQDNVLVPAATAGQNLAVTVGQTIHVAPQPLTVNPDLRDLKWSPPTGSAFEPQPPRPFVAPAAK